VRRYLLIGLLIFSQAAAFAALDQGVGARPISLGYAFVGQADDGSGIFVNPAGVSSIKNLELINMFSSPIENTTFLNLGGALPNIFQGTIGIGYNNSTSTGISVSSTESVDYTEQEILLLYSKKVMENFSLGLNLKFFSKGLSKELPYLIKTQGKGFDIDLGAKYKLNDFTDLGLVLYNILPSGMGGKYTLDHGGEEAIPSTLKLGISSNWFMLEQQLTTNLDLEKAPTTNAPYLLHFGAEYWPIKSFALRMGLDQTTKNQNEAYNNITAGFGIKLAGITLDYAYYTLGDGTNATTNYFSIGYVGPEVVKAKEYFVLDKISDRQVAYTESLEVTGKVFEREVNRIVVNGKNIRIDQDNTFKIPLSLQLGANPYKFEAFDINGKLLKARSLKIIRLKAFKDVDENYWAREPIGYLATIGIISGFPDNTFKPEKAVNRAEMCALLVKSSSTEGQNKLITTEAQNFTDVSNKHWAASFIKTAAQLKLVTGYPDKSFKPGKDINRAEGVSIIARFDNILPARVIEAPFSDIPGRHWAAESITTAKEGGLLDYLKDKPFEPNKPLSRGETAYVLSRTKFAKDKISEMLK